MASMKLCKPSSFSYGATASQSSSAYQHQEYQMKQSSQAHQQAHQSYTTQAQNSQMGRSMHALDKGELGHAWGGEHNSGGQYYAQAQSVLPSPTVHVQQVHRANTMSKQKSHVGQQAASMYANQAQNGYSSRGVGLDDEAHMVGKMDQGWANKAVPYSSSSPVRGNQYGPSIYDNIGSTKGSWAGGANQANHTAQSRYKQQQQGWAGGANQYSSGGKMGQSSPLVILEDEHVMGNMDHGWTSSPTRANHSNLGMHNKGEHMMGSMDHGLVSSLNGANHSNSSFGMHNDEHVMGQLDQVFVTSPTRANHSSHGMHHENDMMGRMDHGSTIKPTRLSSPVRANQYGQSMYKGQGNDRRVEGNWANKSGPTQFNHANKGTMYNDQQRQGWASKNRNSYGTAHGQGHNSAHSMQKHHAEYEDANIDDIMDEILTKYPNHNVGGGNANWAASQKQAHYSSAHQQSAQSMSGYSANSNREVYSAAAGANKFGMNNSMNMNRGIHHDDGISSDDEYDD